MTKQKITNGLKQVNSALLYLMVILLPIYQKPIGLLIALWAFTTLFLVKKSYFKMSKSAFFLILFYLFLIVGIFWSEQKKVASFDLEVKLSLIIFPLFLSAIPIAKKQLKQLIFTFVLSLLGTSLILLTNASIEIYKTGDFYELFYANLSPSIHPTYLSLIHI